MTNREEILQNQRDLVASLQYIAIKNNHPSVEALEALNLAIKGLSELELNECQMVAEIIGDRRPIGALKNETNQILKSIDKGLESLREMADRWDAKP